MSAHVRIDLLGATETPADDLASSFAEPIALAWVCPICGKPRVFDGGRPLGHQDECAECGSRLAVGLEALPALAERQTRRALIDMNLF